MSRPSLGALRARGGAGPRRRVGVRVGHDGVLTAAAQLPSLLPRHRGMHRPKAWAALVLLVGLGLTGLAMPRAVAACSCAMITMEDARNEPEAVVFSGIVDPRDQRGYPVTVTRWFKG